MWYGVLENVDATGHPEHHISIRDASTVSLDRANALEWLVYKDLIAREVSGKLEIAEQQALPLIAEVYHLRELVQSIELLSPQRVQPVQILDGLVGRPYYDISYHQLNTMISMHLSVPKIAQMIGVSVSTIRRRMSEYNLSIRSTYSTITDAELDAIVQEKFSGCGSRYIVASYLMEYVFNSREYGNPNVVLTRKDQ